MEMTRGGINGIVTGPTVPSAGAVKLLEMLAMESGVKTVPASEPKRSEARDPDDLAIKLQEIHDHDPSTYSVARTMIESLHSQISYRKRPSSAKVQAAADVHNGDAIHKVRSRRKPAA